jgi:GTPase SAR1 family protein
MGQEMRVLVKKIQDLRHLGIEDSKIALPKICVVGDQSTGKSSLIEGMSEIKVPRSAGTCTRCPLEINLSESNANQPWTCTISLHRSYIFDGQKKIKKIGKSHPLGPWVPQDPEEELFAVLHDKAMVQEALECAQLAILNPQDDPRRFAPGTVSAMESKYTSVKFSPNVVRIDISAPGFPNLAFYDLPGVISQAEVDEEAFLVTLVENLVKHYVSQDNCIVLLTLPMTDDATNSSAARIVRGIKATHRTLGVLTKPDRVEDIAQWIEILRGDKFALGHGYFVIRNNPDPEVAHQQARMEEAQFFASPLWMDDLGCFQSRFGTRNLQTTLSRLLLSQIQESLPSVIQQINEKAERVDAELSQLPEPLAQNTLWRLYSSLSELKDRIRLCIDGGSTNLPMRKIWFNIAKDFSSTISRTRPSINLKAEKEEFAPDSEEAASNSDCEVMFTRTVKRKTLDAAIKQPTVSTNDDFTEHFKDFCGE